MLNHSFMSGPFDLSITYGLARIGLGVYILNHIGGIGVSVHAGVIELELSFWYDDNGIENEE